MGIFGNPPVGMEGMQIAPAPPEIIGFEDPSGFAAMGKPVPLYRQQDGYKHCKQMGMKNPEEIWDCVRSMSAKLERDEPMLAMEAAFKYLDVTGVYRLMAVLLTGEKPVQNQDMDYT